VRVRYGLRTKQEYVSLNAKELSMVAKVAITLTDEQQARLEQIAEARQESVVAMVEEAVAEYLDADAEYRKYVQEGLDDVAAGRVRDWEDVRAELRAKYPDDDDD